VPLLSHKLLCCSTHLGPRRRALGGRGRPSSLQSSLVCAAPSIAYSCLWFDLSPDLRPPIGCVSSFFLSHRPSSLSTGIYDNGVNLRQYNDPGKQISPLTATPAKKCFARINNPAPKKWPISTTPEEAFKPVSPRGGKDCRLWVWYSLLTCARQRRCRVGQIVQENFRYYFTEILRKSPLF